MVSFTYTIKDKLGIHARPAGMLAKEAIKWIIMDNGTKKAYAKRLMAVMSMGVKMGQVVTVSAEGEDKAVCIQAIFDEIK